MFRRDSLQRSLITLLAFLIVTPQVLLRPCCCAQERIAAASESLATAKASALPPCCQQRELAKRNAATAQVVAGSTDSRPGVHDAGKCGCRAVMQVARTNRVILNLDLLRQVVLEVLAPQGDIGGPISRPQVAFAVAHVMEPDSGPEHCARLCRWLV